MYVLRALEENAATRYQHRCWQQFPLSSFLLYYHFQAWVTAIKCQHQSSHSIKNSITCYFLYLFSWAKHIQEALFTPACKEKLKKSKCMWKKQHRYDMKDNDCVYAWCYCTINCQLTCHVNNKFMRHILQVLNRSMFPPLRVIKSSSTYLVQQDFTPHTRVLKQ